MLLEQPQFDRMIEALAHRVFPNGTVNAIEGRGGDGGRDIEVWNDAQLVAVLQLKCFPEGFTGPYVGRRNQVRRSWRALRGGGASRGTQKPDWPNGKPEQWILVVPCKLTDSERKFLQALVKGQGVRLKVWDRPWLDIRLAEHRDIYEHFQTDVLDERVRLYGQELAVLDGGVPDLMKRISGLSAVANSMDPDYSVDFSSIGGKPSVTLVPRTEKVASETTPLTLKFTASLGPGASEKKDSLEALLNYGLPREIKLGLNEIESASVEGHPEIGPDLTDSEVTILPGPAGELSVKRLSLNFLDEGGRSIGRDSGDVTHVGSGRLGGSIVAAFYRTLNLELAISEGLKKATVNFNIALDGATVPESRRAARLAGRIASGNSMEIAFDGRVLGVAALSGNGGSEFAELENLLAELDVVERATDAYLFPSKDWSNRDWGFGHLACRVIEGDEVEWPGLDELKMTLNGTDSDSLRSLLSGEPMAVVVFLPDFRFDIGGVEVDLGPVRLSHRQMRAEDPEHILALLDAGKAAGGSVTLHADDGYLLVKRGVPSS